MTLRTRLLASYLLLLTLSLSVIVITLVVLLSASPEPDTNTFQDLTRVATGLNTQNLRREFFERNPNRLIANLSELLVDYAEAQDVRLLYISLYRANEGQGWVEYDSYNVYDQNDPIQLKYVDYRPRRFTNRLNQGFTAVYGEFTDPNGSHYLFAGFRPTVGNSETVQAILLSDVPPTRTLQSALAEFGSALATPILQAAIIGLVVAVILATIISRGIANPLQTFARAAGNIARGHYDQQVTVAGPPEVRDVAIAFNRMSAEVRDTQQAQRDFMANVSHDLKTPLTSIQGYSQAIMDGTAKNPAYAAEIIYDEAGRLARMVADLTDLARLQAGGIAMRADTVDVGQMAASIAERLRMVAERKNVTLYTDSNEGLYITGDGDRLAQVLTNLVSNAIKYTPPEGKVWVSSSLSSNGRGNGIQVSVRDNGIGIATDELPRIFERFYQVDKARGPQRGAGLGLAIAREIVHAHHGYIEVKSRGEGYGSTFIVWLPLHQQLAINHS